MRFQRAGLILVAVAALSGCGDRSRSQQYFEAHKDEAEKIVTDCRTGKVVGQECNNADLALRTIRGKERHEKNFGTAKQPNFGDGY